MATKIQAKTSTDEKIMQKPLWDSESLSNALGIDVAKDVKVNSVSIDSRNIQNNALFIGIKGENHNGNFFAIDALEKGASLCIVDEMPQGADKYKGAIIKVESSLDALNKLAAYSRQRLKGKVIGVTGSLGKTSIKEMLRIALENQGETYATVGNFNNHYGLPLSLSNIHESTEYAILEMGMSGAGELSKLTKIAKPDVGIISTVVSAHIEFFTSIAGIAAAKAEILEGVTKDGYAIINADNEYSPIIFNKAKSLNLNVITFGEKNKADFRLLEAETIDDKLHIVTECFKKDVKYTLNTTARHQAFNSIIALAACHAVGAEVTYAAHALRDFASLKGRGQVHHLKKNQTIVIDDCYNANPVSMKAALATLGTFKEKGRLIAVLGNMIGQDQQTHTDLFVDIVNNKVSKVFAVGDNMKELYNKLPEDMRGGFSLDAKGIMDELHSSIQKNDVILVKGSNYMKMNLIIDNLLNA